MASYILTDVYDWIWRHLPHLRSGSSESLELDTRDGKRLTVIAHSNGTREVFLYLQWDSVRIGQLGTCCIADCGEKAMQQNLFNIFSNLCIYAFLKLNHQFIVNLRLRSNSGLLKKLKGYVLQKKSGYRRLEAEEDEDLLHLDLLRLKFVPSGTIESGEIKKVFNSIFFAASYSHLSIHLEFESNKSLVQELQKLAAQIAKETLRIINPEATDCLMRSLAANFTEICLRSTSGRIDPFKMCYSKMCYSSSSSAYWTINAYCPRLSMKKMSNQDNNKKRTKLKRVLRHQLLHCFLEFRHEVSVHADYIDVEMKINNLRCQPIQICQEIPTELQNERYFPAKISLLIESVNKSAVQGVYLAASSQNPEVTATQGRNNEFSFQAGFGNRNVEPNFNVGLMFGQNTSHTRKLTNWRFDQSVVKNANGRLEWSLHDNKDGKQVFSYTPPRFNFWKRDECYEAFRALAKAEGLASPFTSQGGVVFAGDLYGKPITWRLKRDLEEQTLKWKVKGEIWLAYYPNEYDSKRFMEIRYHEFCEQVELPLLQSQPHGNPNRSQ